MTASIKKTLSVILLLSLLSPLFCISGAASAAPEIRISSVTAAPGETVDVEVQFLNNPGINTFALSIVYDSTYLNLNSVTPNPSIGGQFFFVKRAVWFSGGDISYNGTFLTLNFTVSADAEVKEYPVSVSYGTGDIGNYAEDTVDFTVTPGKITVQKVLTKRGDLDGDGKVNAFDALQLKLIIVGKKERVPSADIDGDNKINATDALILKKIIVGKV